MEIHSWQERPELTGISGNPSRKGRQNLAVVPPIFLVVVVVHLAFTSDKIVRPDISYLILSAGSASWKYQINANQTDNQQMTVSLFSEEHFIIKDLPCSVDTENVKIEHHFII